MTTRARAEKKHCGYCGLTFFNDGHHAEVCTGPKDSTGGRAVSDSEATSAERGSVEQGPGMGARTPAPHYPVFLSEPEYAREQAADDRDLRHEAYEDERLSYPEKGLHE